ncbi:family 16 glycoside hydrolase [Kitasatospora sp. NPDC051914]|uniref:family 16 glycoside hydrolase n=1 Tax=Kitasatospora sp. NPDC051914 TaxID=3154945 RepID=UPI003414E473
MLVDMHLDRPTWAALTRGRAGRPPRPSRRIRWILVTLGSLLIALVLVVAIGLSSGSDVKTVHGPWRVVFDGEGLVGFDDGTVVLKPRHSAAPSETHAALVVSVDSHGKLDYRLQMRTAEQFRRPDPNSWEVAWVLWHYTDPQHFYYLALKPTGWELGKEDPAYPGSQRFLATGLPAYPIGPWYDVEIQQSGPTMSVTVQDRPLVTFTDEERPYLEGNVGLYSEDAHAEFRHFAY